MSAHTKGPWHAPGLFEVHDERHNIVADCNPHLNNEEPAVTSAEGEANARLIAAAPDLLTALQELLTYPAGSWPFVLKQNAKAAIAKATGAPQ